MEILYSILALFCGVFLSHNAWKILMWAWVEPKKMEKRLREQGFEGNSYRFMIGDFKEIATMAKEAHAKPMPFSNVIAPRVIPFIRDSLQKYGENCFIWFGSKPTVLISDHELIKEILSKNYVFQKMSTPLDKFLAQGIAAYETDKWAKHRRLLNPAFHLEKLKLMLPLFHLSCAEMLSKFEKIIPTDGSCEVDVWPYLQALSSDLISRTAFGSNYEEGRRIFELQKEQGGVVLQAFQKLYIPGWRFLPTKINTRMKEISKEVDSSILGIINKRMRLIEAGETDSNDLLGILLESNLKEIKQNGNELGMSMREMIDECKLFYIAGQETTSALLVWTMILRLYPAAVMLSRTIHNETAVGNVILPAGVQIFLPTLLVQHDCKIWGEDANEFKPERFSEGVLKATKGQLVYFPFGGGPRICIGQNFAMLEAKLALALILKHYSFELSPSYTHAPDMVLSLQPQFGAPLILQRLH